MNQSTPGQPGMPELQDRENSPDNPPLTASALPEMDTVRLILARFRRVAVVGLSPKAHRESYGVAQYMQAHGWQIIPINPNAGAILGERAYPTLQEARREHTIEVVNVFRNAEDVPPVVDDAIAIGAQALWLQLGIAHAVAAARARAAGLLVVENRCLKVDHARWT